MSGLPGKCRLPGGKEDPDPRLSLMETVVRQNAIDLTGAPGTKIEAIDTASTLGEAVAGNAK